MLSAFWELLFAYFKWCLFGVIAFLFYCAIINYLLPYIWEGKGVEGFFKYYFSIVAFSATMAGLCFSANRSSENQEQKILYYNAGESSLKAFVFLIMIGAFRFALDAFTIINLPVYANVMLKVTFLIPSFVLGYLSALLIYRAVDNIIGNSLEYDKEKEIIDKTLEAVNEMKRRSKEERK